MRYVRIFLIHFEDAIVDRSRSFVWFLIALINPLMLLLFWRGAILEKPEAYGQWNVPSVVSYYFLLIIAGAFLQVHIDEKIAYTDIQQGALANYLTRPFSYLVWNFFIELPYRIIQGSFGIMVFLIGSAVIGHIIAIANDPMVLFLAIIVVLLGFLISFLFKMILGLSALWTTDFSGLTNFIEVVTLVLGGFILPIHLFPQLLQRISFGFPFVYMFYFPIIAVMGRLGITELLQLIATQFVWVMGLGLMYRFVWNRGIRLFTAIGQ